jgi:carbon storage regulator
MLVLSRQRDETIMIGDDIEITVVDVRGDKVRLGINAPARIAVHRKEVYEAIRAENERAARVDGDDLAELSKAALARGRGGQTRNGITNRSSGLVQTQPPNGSAQKRA